MEFTFFLRSSCHRFVENSTNIRVRTIRLLIFSYLYLNFINKERNKKEQINIVLYKQQ